MWGVCWYAPVWVLKIAFDLALYIYFKSTLNYYSKYGKSHVLCGFIDYYESVWLCGQLAIILQVIWHLLWVAPKMAVVWYAVTSSNTNRFSKLFHCQNQKKMCNKTVTKDPTTLQVCRYATLWNVKCLESNNWQQNDFCNNTFFKEINNREQYVYCLSYCLK